LEKPHNNVFIKSIPDLLYRYVGEYVFDVFDKKDIICVIYESVSSVGKWVEQNYSRIN